MQAVQRAFEKWKLSPIHRLYFDLISQQILGGDSLAIEVAEETIEISKSPNTHNKTAGNVWNWTTAYLVMIQSNIPKQCILAQNACDFWSYPFLESRRCVSSGNDSRRNRSVKDHTPIYFYAYDDFSQCFRNSIKNWLFLSR